MGYFKIGQLSKLFKINKQTLQYYDRIDLFKPSALDESNGYRMYQSSQIYELATIRYLKKIGYSLDEISHYMKYKDPKKTLESLEQHSDILLKQSEELLRTRKAIQRKINFTREQLCHLDTDKIEVKSFPNRYFIPIGDDNIVFYSNFFYFFPTIAFYDEEFKSFGAYIGNDLKEIEEDKELFSAAKDLSLIDQGTFLCGYHVGPYEKIKEKVAEMRNAFRGLSLENKSIHFNIVDQFLESQKENYITEIEIRIVGK